MAIYDLVYAGKEYQDEIKGLIQAQFPEAKIENASDFLHEGRFSVEIDDIEQDDWLLFTMVEGFLNMSLMSQGERMENPAHYLELMKRAVEIKKQQSENSF